MNTDARRPMAQSERKHSVREQQLEYSLKGLRPFVATKVLPYCMAEDEAK